MVWTLASSALRILPLILSALKSVSTLVPRLDFFAKSEWLVYGLNSREEWQLFLLQSAIFIPLLVLAAVLDFRRKEF